MLNLKTARTYFTNQLQFQKVKLKANPTAKKVKCCESALLQQPTANRRGSVPV